MFLVMPEICIDNYNGYLIEEKSVNEIVSAIKKLNKEKLSEFNKNPFFLREKFDIMINSKLKITELNH